MLYLTIVPKPQEFFATPSDSNSDEMLLGVLSALSAPTLAKIASRNRASVLELKCFNVKNCPIWDSVRRTYNLMISRSKPDVALALEMVVGLVLVRQFGYTIPAREESVATFIERHLGCSMEQFMSAMDGIAYAMVGACLTHFDLHIPSIIRQMNMLAGARTGAEPIYVGTCESLQLF